MQKLLTIKNEDLDQFKSYLISLNQSGSTRLFQTPFSKFLIQVNQKNDVIELYAKFDVFLSNVLPPLIMVTFVNNEEFIDIFKSYSMPRYIYFQFISMIIFIQIFTTLMDMSSGRVFIFFAFTLFFLIYYLIIIYFSLKKINELLLKAIKMFNSYTQ